MRKDDDASTHARRLNDLADVLESILDVSGSLISSEHARILMGQQTQTLVLANEFSAAVEALQERDTLRVKKKVGSSEFQVGLSAAALKDIKERIARQSARAPVVWAERQLMPSLFRYLHYRFHHVQKFAADARWHIVQTDTGSRKKGKWSLGDYTGIQAERSQGGRGHDLILHSFELKRNQGGDVSAVSQALRQSSTAHYGYLVWHCPETERESRNFGDVESECRDTGVGLIVFDHPQDLDGWRLLHRAHFNQRPPTIGNQFVRDWLADNEQFLGSVDL